MCLLLMYILYQEPASMSRNPLSALLGSDKFSRQKGLLFVGPSTAKVHPNMTLDEADIAFFKFISNLHLLCENALRFGNALDGGWDMCIAKPYRPKEPCLVYSFGINNDFSFDDAISRKFNCTVRSFDPSMKAGTHRRSDRVWFYKIGIGGNNTVNDRHWTLKTFTDITALFNETDTIIDYLKIDVESSEWPSLVPMLEGDTLSRVKQFGVEIHIGQFTVQTLYYQYMLLKRLEDAGFRRWYFARNYYRVIKRRTGFRSCCYEMVYINTRFLKQ